jgi:hypothetical protein
MIPNVNPKRWLLPILLPLLATGSCSDDRAVQISREAADRQAQQNTAMVNLQKEVASGSSKLVEADAQARKEIVGVHHDLQSERTRLDTSWKDLENERRQIAGQRRTESMLVSVCELLDGISLVLVLLGFCWYALVATRRGDETDALLNQLLVQEMLPDEPTRLVLGGQLPSLLDHFHLTERSPE